MRSFKHLYDVTSPRLGDKQLLQNNLEVTGQEYSVSWMGGRKSGGPCETDLTVPPGGCCALTSMLT